MLEDNDQICMGGCRVNEDVDHLFIKCVFFREIWSFVTNRLSFVTVISCAITGHLAKSFCDTSYIGSTCLVNTFHFFLNVNRRGM